MKYKTLRKKHTKEYVVLGFRDNFKCLFEVYTTEIPRLQPMTASMNLLKEMYGSYDLRGYSFEDFEFVELDVIDADVIGADIRNKLTPFNSMIMLHKLIKNDKYEESKVALEKLLDDAINRSEECVKYLSNLL